MDTVHEKTNTEEVQTSIDESKREAKLVQLAAARQSAKDKKRKRDEDISEMNRKIDQLLKKQEAKTAQSEAQQEAKPEVVQPEAPRSKSEAPEPRPKRVTREEVETEEDEKEAPPEGDNWTTSLIRTSAVLTLGGLSWWFQNKYGQADSVRTPGPPIKKKAKAAPANMLPVRVPPRPRTLIGRSGFAS